MSPFTTLFVIVVALVAVANLTTPATTSRCCHDPAHKSDLGDSEMMYCAGRGY